MFVGIGIFILSLSSGRSPQETFEPKDWAFAGMFSVDKRAAESLTRAAQKRLPGVRSSEDINRVFMKAVLADRSPETYGVLTSGFPRVVRAIGMQVELVSIQAVGISTSKKPKLPEQVTIDIGSVQRIEHLEDSQVWMRIRHGLRVPHAPETRPDTPRIRILSYTRPDLPRQYLEGHIYYRGVAIQLEPCDLLDASATERFLELHTTVGGTVVRGYDELFRETVEVMTALEK